MVKELACVDFGWAWCEDLGFRMLMLLAYLASFFDARVLFSSGKYHVGFA